LQIVGSFSEAVFNVFQFSSDGIASRRWNVKPSKKWLFYLKIWALY